MTRFDLLWRFRLPKLFVIFRPYPLWLWYILLYIGKISKQNFVAFVYLYDFSMKYEFSHLKLKKKIFQSYTYICTCTYISYLITSMFLWGNYNIYNTRQILKLSSMWVLVFAAFLNSRKTNYKWQRRPNISRSLRVGGGGLLLPSRPYKLKETLCFLVICYQYVKQDFVWTWWEKCPQFHASKHFPNISCYFLQDFLSPSKKDKSASPFM